MPGTIEQIQVILQAITSGFAAGLDRAQTQLKNVGKNMQEFGTVMKAPMKNFKEMNGKMGVLKTLGGKVANRFRMMTHGMRGFRMEALGVMFFGMMMQRMFMQLLQPVMDAYGVFDIFRLMLLTLFLPVMDMIFPFLLGIMEWFMNLPESVKKAIGIFVVLGVIFGTVLMVLGQFALGIGSLILFFGALASPIFLIIGALAAIAGFFILKALFKSIGDASDKLGEKLTTFGISGEVFIKMKDKVIEWCKVLKEKILEVLPIVWGKIKTFFGMVWELVKQWVLNTIQTLGENLPNIIGKISEWMTGIKQTIVDNLPKIVNAIAKIINGIIKFIGDNLPTIVQAGLDILLALVQGIEDNLDQIVGAIEKAVESITTWVLNNGAKIIGIGLQIGAAIVIGIVNAFWNVGESIGNAIAGSFGFDTESYKNQGGYDNYDDFIWKPGQTPVSINPNDTLVGFKGAPPNLGGGGGSLIQNNNFYGFTMDDLKRELDNRDRRVVDDLRRLIKQ